MGQRLWHEGLSRAWQVARLAEKLDGLVGSLIGFSPFWLGRNPGSGAALAGCEAGDLAGAVALALARRVWGRPVEASGQSAQQA